MARAGRGWWRSAGVRFGFAYAILFGFSTIAVVAFVWWLTAGELERQTAADIDRDWQKYLVPAFVAGGLEGLKDAIAERVDANTEDDAFYLLVDRQLRWQAGNLTKWPASVTGETSPINLQLERWGQTVPVRMSYFPLAEGSHLLIGRNVRLQAMLWSKLVDAVPWTVAIMALLGVIGAVTVRRLFVSMLADVSATASSITAGDLASRVPVAGRGDEFDQLAETINDMLDRISRLMDGVREVSNAIAHDLRTPIARARARLEDAARAGESEAELRAAIERAVADLDGVTSVFHALLRIAEIEAGARRSAFTSVDLSPLLRDMGELYEAAAEAAGQSLVLDLPGTLRIFGDRDMLQQAVANLLDNAIKFSPSGSAVRVTAGVGPNRSSLWIAVSDEGPGIPEQDRGRATERFFRGESARHAPGSGLGLALVQAVAGLHGGTLRLEDNAPGLRAVMVLPAPAPAPQMERVSREPQNGAMAEPA